MQQKNAFFGLQDFGDFIYQALESVVKLAGRGHAAAPTEAGPGAKRAFCACTS